MLEMLRKLGAALADRQMMHELRGRIRRAEASLATIELGRLEQRLIASLAALWYRAEREQSARVTRVLIGHDKTVTVTGTMVEIRAMAVRLARESRTCVVITAVLARALPCGQVVN